MGTAYSESYEEYIKIAEGADKIKADHTKVAQEMENYVAADEAPDSDAKKGKKRIGYIKDLGNRGKNITAGIMSKFNKQYVGQFSNVSTNTRNFMKDFRMDEFGQAGTKEGALAAIARSYFEVLEQDSISAKKIYQRMASQDFDSYAFDELQEVLDLVQRGEDEASLEKMKQMDIKVGGRQFQFEKASVIAALGENGEKQWNEWFGDKSEQEIVAEALGRVRKVMTEQQLTAKDVAFKTQDRKEAIDKFQKAKGKNVVNKSTGLTRINGKSTNEVLSEKAVAKEAENAAKATEDMIKAEKELAATEAGLTEPRYDRNYQALESSDSADYGTTHARDYRDYQTGEKYDPGFVTRANGKTEQRAASATRMQDLIGYRNSKDIKLYPEKEKQLKESAARGTYAHFLAEVMNKTNTTSVQDTIDSGQTINGKKISDAINEAEIELFKVLGLEMTNDTVEKLRQETEAGINSIQGTELAAANSEQEVTFGGKFTRKTLAGRDRYVSGQADMIGWKGDGSGITIGDWKFSGKNDDATSAKRIMQASMYLAMYKQDLKEQLDAINKGNAVGTEEELAAKASEIQSKLNAINNGNNTLDIRRVKNGVVEVFKADLINDAEMLQYIDEASEYLDLDVELEQLEQAAKQGKAKEGHSDKVKAIKARMKEIEGNLPTTEQILNRAGLSRDEEGQLVNAAGLSPFSTGKYNAETKTIEGVTAGRAVKESSNSKAMNEYYKTYKSILDIATSILKYEDQMIDATEAGKKELEGQVEAAKEQLAIEKEKLGVYDQEKGVLNGIQLSEEEATNLNDRLRSVDYKNDQKQYAITTKRAEKNEKAQIKQGDAEVKSTINNYKQQLQLMREIYTLETKLAYGSNATNKAGIEAELNIVRERLQATKEEAGIFDQEQQTLNGIKLTEEQILTLAKKTGSLDAEHEQKLTGLGADRATKAENLRSKEAKSNISDYMKYYKRGQKLEEDIRRTEGNIQNSSGSTQRREEARLKVLQEQLITNKQMMGDYDENNRILRGIVLSEEERLKINKLIEVSDNQHNLNLDAINTKLKTQAGLLDKMLNGFKQQFSNFLGMNLTYQMVGKLRQMFTEILSTVKELDANMVDIQIACGQSREEVEGMMKGFNELAMKTGRSTNDVASAANDWLRAGYTGGNVTTLTEASMQLSTLGMIEASEATTDLISSLKGWKLEAKEVSGVVDKLTTLDMAYATSAGDLAQAMSRANNIARSAGSNMDNFMAYITVSTDVTQKAAESVGESWKTLYSRINNIKAGKKICP